MDVEPRVTEWRTLDAKKQPVLAFIWRSNFRQEEKLQFILDALQTVATIERQYGERLEGVEFQERKDTMEWQWRASYVLNPEEY